MTDITQKLPLELLAEILGYAPVPDVSRVKKVKSDLESVTRAWANLSNADGFCRSTVSFVMSSTHLRCKSTDGIHGVDLRQTHSRTNGCGEPVGRK